MALVSRSNIKIFSLAELKIFLKVTQNNEDEFLNSMIFDAMQFCESHTGQAVTELTARDYFNADLYDLKTKYTNAKEVTLVEYLNTSNEWTTLSSDLYFLREDVRPSVVHLRMDESTFPDLNDDEDQVLRVTYKAGPGEGEELAVWIRRACFLFCGFFYEHRQATEVPEYLSEMLTFDRDQHVF